MIFSALLVGQTPGSSPRQLDIRSVEVLYANEKPDQLLVRGANFGPSTGTAEVDGLPLASVVWTDTMITGKLPSLNMGAASYALKIAAGPAALQRDRFEFSLAVQGPQGPAGPQGAA